MAWLGALLCAATAAGATDQLLYLEAQGVAGYDFRDREAQYVSMNPQAEMQNLFTSLRAQWRPASNRALCASKTTNSRTCTARLAIRMRAPRERGSSSCRARYALAANGIA